MSSMRLLNTLREAKQRKEQYVTSGHVTDYASYRFYVGEIKGLQDAIDICKEIFKGEFENDK